MKFTLSKNREQDVWNIRPNSGAFESVLVATAEQINLKQVTFEGRTLVGTIRAMWGITILCEDVYNDPATLRGLGLGGVFDSMLKESMTEDYDGFFDSDNKLCKSAKWVLVTRDEIYVRGAE